MARPLAAGLHVLLVLASIEGRKVSVETLAREGIVETLGREGSVETLGKEGSVDTLAKEGSVETFAKEGSVETLARERSVDTLDREGRNAFTADPLVDSNARRMELLAKARFDTDNISRLLKMNLLRQIVTAAGSSAFNLAFSSTSSTSTSSISSTSISSTSSTNPPEYSPM